MRAHRWLAEATHIKHVFRGSRPEASRHPGQVAKAELQSVQLCPGRLVSLGLSPAAQSPDSVSVFVAWPVLETLPTETEHMVDLNASVHDSSRPVLQGDRLDKVFELLHYLKIAVEDIRAKLASKHKPHYTVEEVADLTGRSGYTVRWWVSTGRIKAIRVRGTGPKGRLLIPREQLNVLIGAGMGAEVPAAAID